MIFSKHFKFNYSHFEIFPRNFLESFVMNHGLVTVAKYFVVKSHKSTDNSGKFT